MERAQIDLLKEENKILKIRLKKAEDADMKQEEKYEFSLRKKIKIIT